MMKLHWGFIFFMALFFTVFIMGHLETDGESIGIVLWEPVKQPKVSEIVIDKNPETAAFEITKKKNRPLFPRVHRFFHPNKYQHFTRFPLTK